jgi:hypothetical protein
MRSHKQRRASQNLKINCAHFNFQLILTLSNIKKLLSLSSNSSNLYLREVNVISKLKSGGSILDNFDFKFDSSKIFYIAFL